MADVKKIDIKSMTVDELKNLLAEWGQKPFRAGQIFSWLHKKNVTSFEEMTDLSKDLREELIKKAKIETLSPLQLFKSELDPTKKYLWKLDDGNVIESVWMEYNYGNSVCISSQVGCGCGCKFCASTIGGLVRDLTAAEMAEQVYKMQKLEGKRISNIVIMGVGEPLLNFDNFVRFVEIVSDKGGMNISGRNITVSTCGIVPAIYNLAEKRLQLTLAISLHAPNAEIRKSLMPVEAKYSIKDLLEAGKYYFDRTKRRVSYEYALIEGVNNKRENAEELAGILKNQNCHVNLIKYNSVEERTFADAGKRAAETFKNILEKNGINVTIRRSLGADIDGACGQLRRRYLK